MIRVGLRRTSEEELRAATRVDARTRIGWHVLADTRPSRGDGHRVFRVAYRFHPRPVRVRMVPFSHEACRSSGAGETGRAYETTTTRGRITVQGRSTRVIVEGGHEHVAC